MIDAPTDYQVVIANSHVKAAKSASARDEFNSRIASYNLGLALLKQRCPEIAGTVKYLRDIDPAKFGYPTSDVYRWLLRVPESMTRNDFRTMLSPEHERLMEMQFRHARRAGRLSSPRRAVVRHRRNPPQPDVRRFAGGRAGRGVRPA